MGFDNKYPYTDFHELNLDWILEQMKELAAAWDAYQEELTGENGEWPTFKSYIETEWQNYQEALTGPNGTWPTFKATMEQAWLDYQNNLTGPNGEWPTFKTTMETEWQQFFNDYLQTLGVVQTKGTSITNVMSQKAVTDELDILTNKIQIPFTAPTGYLSSTGSVIASNTLYHTDEYIEITEGETIEVDNINAAASTYALFFDINKLRITSQQLSDVVVDHVMTLTAPAGSKYFRTTLTSTNSNIRIIKSQYEENSELTSKDNNYYRKSIPDVTWNKYLASGGNPVTINQPYGVTDYIFVNPGEKVLVKNHITSSGMYYCFYDKDKNRISSIHTTVLTDDPALLDVPDQAQYLRMTVHVIQAANDWTNIKCLEEIEIENYIDYREIVYKQIEQAEGLDILPAFNNITCIGDSLTYGLVYYDGGTRQAYNPYPTILQKKTGSVVENISQSGADALNWWNNFNTQIVSKTNQLVIIYLGSNSGLTDTLDTDAPAADPYTDWANTNTGSYAKIVAKAQAAGARVILIKIYATNGDLTITNDVIDQIGARFKCAVVTPIVLPLKYHYYPDYSGTNAVHLNDLGYAAFASSFINKVSVLSQDQMKLIIPE